MIEYGPQGFDPGYDSSTLVHVTTSPFIVTDLAPESTYDFYSYPKIDNTTVMRASCHNPTTITTPSNCIVTDTLVLSIPRSGLPYIFNGDTIRQAGSYTYSFVTASDCDSILTVILNHNCNTFSDTTATACDSLVWHQITYTTSTDSATFATQNAIGCDSIVTLHLTIHRSDSVSMNIASCDSYTWDVDNRTYTHDTTLYTVIPNHLGCDSVLKLHLTILPSPVLHHIPDTVLSAEQSLTLHASGADMYTWYDINDNVLSNDSLLTVTPSTTTKYILSAFNQGGNLVYNGDFELGNVGFTTAYTYSTSLTPEGQYMIGTNAQDYHYGFTGANDHTSGSSNYMIVNGAPGIGTILWTQQVSVQPHTNYAFSVWGTNVSPYSQEYMARLQFSINGTQIGDIFQLPTPLNTWTQFYEIWDSDTNTLAEITILNQNTVSAGNDFGVDDIYFSNLTTCRSNDTIQVFVGQHIDSVVCDNHFPIVWNGIRFDAPGAKSATLTDRWGNDSIVVMNVRSIPSTYKEYAQTVCDSFLWNGVVYTESDTLKYTTLNAVGCDSTVTLHLTVLSPIRHDTLDVGICESQSYEWHGNVYDAPGLYHDTAFYSSLHCDSLVSSLILNIVPMPRITTTLLPSAEPTASSPLTFTINYGDTVLLSASGADHYSWYCSSDTDTAEPVGTSASVLVSPHSSATYIVRGCGNAPSSCCTVDTLFIDVRHPNYVFPDARSYTACSDSSITVFLSLQSGIRFEWYRDSSRTSLLGIGDSLSVTKDISDTQYVWVLPLKGDIPLTDAVPIPIYRSNLCGEVSETSCDGVILFCQDFGGNDTDDPSTATSDFIGGRSDLPFNANTLGFYGLYKTITFQPNYVCPSDDHTFPNDTTRGYFLYLDPGPGDMDAVLYEMNLTNLMPQAPLSFSFWASDLQRYDAHPKFEIRLKDTTTSNIVLRSNILTPPRHNPHWWYQYGFVFSLPDTMTSVMLQIINKNVDYIGNDWAIDDIKISYCDIGLSILGNDTSVCENAPLALLARLEDESSRFSCESLSYQWEYTHELSNGSVWQTIETAHEPLLSIDSVGVGNEGFYRIRAITSPSNASFVSLPIHLSVRRHSSSDTTASVCDSLVWYGTRYDTSTTASHHLVNSQGCDSLLSLHLTVRRSSASDTTAVACDSLNWWGTPFFASAEPTHLLTNTAGCDSTVTLHLTIHYSSSSTLDSTIVENSLPLTWNGVTFSRQDTLLAHLQNSVACDSLVTMRLRVLPNVSGEDDSTICLNQLPITWNGVVFDSADLSQPLSLRQQIVKSATLISPTGSDSLLTLTLHVNPSFDLHLSDTLCNNHFPYTWEDTTFLSHNQLHAITYRYSTQSSFGCDSLRTLHLTVLDTSVSTFSDTIVENALPYAFNGHSFNQSVSDSIVVISNHIGCDSVIHFSLTVHLNVSTNIDSTVCLSQLPLTWNDVVFDSADLNTNLPSDIPLSLTKNATLTSHTGSDSVVVMTLTANPSYNFHLFDTLCNNQLPYLWDSIWFESGGTQNLFEQTLLGCDSITHYSLTVFDTVATIDSVDQCQPLLWIDGQTYIHDTVGPQFTLQNIHGCDSVVTLSFRISHLSYTLLTDSLCHGNTYMFNGQTLSSAGIYFDTLPNIEGCDSIIQLTLRELLPHEITFDVSYDCEDLSYTLSANTDARYTLWSSIPLSDEIEAQEQLKEITIHPSVPTLYTLYADFSETPFCPSSKNIAIDPLVKPVAQIEAKPPFLSTEHLDFIAIDRSTSATQRTWTVNGHNFGSESTIAYSASRNEDSLIVSLIVSNSTCADTDVVVIPIIHTDLFVPNVFTPGQTTNNTFSIVGKDILNGELQIYNREGLMVFSSSDPNTPWDGTHNGEPCSQGTYIYKFRYTLSLQPDTWHTWVGSITLIR